MSDLWIFVIGVFVFLVNVYAILAVGYFEGRDPAHSTSVAERTDKREAVPEPDST